MSEHLMWLVSYHTPLDLTGYPAHLPRATLPSQPRPLPKSVWPYPEPFPMKLVHLDLSDLLLHGPRWEEWKRGEYGALNQELEKKSRGFNGKMIYYRTEPKEIQEIVIYLGSVPDSVVIPVSPAVPICHVCRKPLATYRFAMRDEDPGFPRGFCPGCHLRALWSREWREQKEKAGRAQEKYGTLEATYVAQAQADFLRAWNRRDREWWEDQRAQRTPLYRDWIGRQDPTPWTTPESDTESWEERS